MSGSVIAAQDKYTVKAPNGLAFSEFRGYEDWQSVGPSLTDAPNVIRLIVANPVMINAYKSGVPANGKPFRDTHGSGYGTCEYDVASEAFSPATAASSRRRDRTPSAAPRGATRGVKGLHFTPYAKR